MIRFAVVLLLAALPLVGQDAFGIRIESDRVRVTNASPESEVILFGVVREPHQYYAHVRSHEAVLFADAAGQAQWTSPAPIPTTSVWCAVDLTSGEYAIAGPPQFPLEVTELPLTALRRNGAGAAEAFALDIAVARFLVVRPHKGAWTGQVSDGGPGDTDGRNDGQWRALFENVRPIGDPKKERPKHLLPHDVLVLVDSSDLDVFVAVER